MRSLAYIVATAILASYELLLLICFTVYIIIRHIFRFFLPGPPVSLRGEIILVTGGANGIGREICRQLVRTETDLTIIIWDVNEKAGLKTVQELDALGVRKAVAYNVDVSDRGQVRAAAAKLRDEIGDVTILFNNAGISGNLKPAWKEDPEVLEKVFAVNLFSHALTLREFLPSMIESGRGHVVETCSILGYLTGPSGSSYVASKYAVRGYIESVKEDVRHLQSKPEIFFTVAYPCVVATDMTAKLNLHMERYNSITVHMKPEYAARKIVDGVLYRMEHVFIPEISCIVRLMNILPSEVRRKIHDIVGAKPLHVEAMSMRG